tara:strand:- start:15169 stop:16797 length:1629 start_codon:yes stop_codon:yes gene_type:complete
MQINTVTIVGGGSSGWMTAAALAKLCPHLDITLVESKNIKTVGVGESTLGHINKFIRMLGLKDEDWMAACNATYKNSIRFTNFREGKGESFEYPFGNGYDFTDLNSGLETWSQLSAMYPEEFTPDTFAKMYASANTALALHNKQSNNDDGRLRSYNFAYDTAYHMDAGLFGEYLRDNIALPSGVKHMYKDVHSFTQDSKGNIIQILCKDSHHLSADLFIDCTGFKSQLLEQWMGQQFLPFDKHLANDKAWACRVPYIDREREMHNVTDCHALDNGWVWNIPLWNRIGTGYVFSSRFISPEGAKQEFLEHIAKVHSPEIAKDAESTMFMVNMKHGRRRKAFFKNVVGIGLSYGFVEPLESTGLLTTHENILKLVDLINRRDGYITNSEKEAYNFSVEYDLMGFRDFVSMHYALSKRTDTPYWRWCTQTNEYHPTMFNEFIPVQNSYTNLLVAIQSNNMYQAQNQGSNYIAAGMGVRSVSTREGVIESYSNSLARGGSTIDALEDSRRKYHQHQEWINRYMQSLPSHYQYLKDNIYGGVDKYES